MKTSVIMTRKMGEFEVLQRTKDSMFNATALVKQWNTVKSKGRKDVSDFLRNSNSKDFIEALSEDLETDTRNLVSIVRGKNQGTWMHPYLFIKFAMWINPKFEISVIRFVYDQLIQERHIAGDNYKVLSRAGAKLKGYNYSEVAVALQWIVFNTNGKNLRQKATQEQLKELGQVQSNLAYSIDMGHIKSYNQLMHELTILWKRKYKSNPISV